MKRLILLGGNPNAGLMYRGYDIHEWRQKAKLRGSPLTCCSTASYPMESNWPSLRNQIAAERALRAQSTEMLRLLPSTTHPMDMLRTGVSMLSAFDKGP